MNSPAISNVIGTEKYNKTKNEILACLIIDDPLLKPSYGCINFTKLLEQMKNHVFFTEIAFIPWNYKRSDPKTVRLFADNPDHYAICVHGCNHTRNEFGQIDYDNLSSLTSLALYKMELHKKITGLSYDPVFVFPQGYFSSVAMKVLKEQGFFAAFNSIIEATDIKTPPSSIEYLKPATTIYWDFPLFLRRHPNNKEHFIQDIKNGRPLLIIEHHNSFRNGYKKITDLIDWINNLGNIKWTSLLNIAECYLESKFTGTKIITPLLINIKSSSKVTIRRVLSEARDNIIEKNDLLAYAYAKIRKLSKELSI